MKRRTWAMLRIVAWAAMVLPLAAGGCSRAEVAGYHAGGLYDTSIRTVAVPVFKNRTFYRETEFRLTEALIKQIESRTPYKVVRTGEADTSITGTVLSVDQRLLSRDFTTGITQEAQVVITASFEWKDLRTGKIIRKRSRIMGTGVYVPTRGVGEPVDVAEYAAVDQLGREIVSVMATDW